MLVVVHARVRVTQSLFFSLACDAHSLATLAHVECSFVHDIHLRVKHARSRSSFVYNPRILVIFARSGRTCAGDPRMYRSVCVELYLDCLDLSSVCV